MARETPIRFKASVVVPVIEPLYLFSERLISNFSPAIRELIAFTTEELGFKDYQPEKLKVRILKQPKTKRFRNVLIAGNKLPRLHCTQIEFAIHLTLTDFSLEG